MVTIPRLNKKQYLSLAKQHLDTARAAKAAGDKLSKKDAVPVRHMQAIEARIAKSFVGEYRAERAKEKRKGTR